MSRGFRFLWCTMLIFASIGTVQAQITIYGLGTVTQPVATRNFYFPAGASPGDQGIITFDVASGLPRVDPTTGLVKVVGVMSGQTLVGIDSRPLNGLLYALGYNPAAASNNTQLYILSPTTGQVTSVGSPIQLNLGTDVTRIGFDFNPVADRIRVVSPTDKNYRLDPNNPATGVLAATDTDLNYPGGTPADPGVGAAAYINSFLGATTTTLYDIDELNGPTLVTQAPPNSGTLNTVGLVRTPPSASFVNFTVATALDIDVFYNSTSGTNRAFLVEVSNRNAGGQASSNLYDINLATGEVSSKKLLVPADPSTPFEVRDIAVPITPPVCDAPTNPTSSSVTSTGATITFTPSASATNYTVTVTPATGAPTTQTATGSPVALTGLTPNTAYTVSIVSNCFSGLLTSSAVSTSFTTLAPAPAPALVVTQGTTTITNNGSPSYSFGNQTTGSTPTVTFTLSNPGNTALTISGISATNPSVFNFQTFATPVTIAAGGSTSLTVSYAVGTGAQSGTITLTSNATNGNATFNLNLTGNGVPAVANPQIAVSQGGTSIANGGTFAGFASTNVGSTSAPISFIITNSSATDNLTLGSFALTGPFALSGAAPTSVAPNSSATFMLTFTPTASGTNTGSVSIPNNSQANNPFVINLSGQGTLADLIVSSNQTISGSYNNVTVTSTGNATLGGPLSVAGTFLVQSGGTLTQNCQPLTGSGNFTLQAGGNLVICDVAGIATTGTTGAIQVMGTRSFSPDANYGYANTAAQVTGPGLPSRILNLAMSNPAGVSLSQALNITQRVVLQVGNLNTNGQTLTLLSSSAGTAVVVNTNGAVNGPTTVQRYIDPTRNPGRGYRHFSAPVANTTVADLATSSFTPVVNPRYNTVGSTVTSFPTVFGYDEQRVTTSGNAGSADFDRGFFSPDALTDALVPTRGYTVNIGANQVVDFVGTPNNGTLAAAGLTRGSQTESGYHLRGNPYPSTLDWNLMVANGRLTNVDNTLYVFKSSGQYTGGYASYLNGQATNGGTNLLPVAQGFFVRTSTVGASGSVTFTNQERLTSYDTTPFQRGTADTRTQLLLSLSNAAVATQANIYFERGATAGFDRAFDAHHLPASNGLTLATEAGAEPLAINGQPLLTGADLLLPLRVGALSSGAYTLAVDNLANLPTGYRAYLRDALTGTFTDLATTPAVSLTLAANAATSGRYSVLFSTQARVLATAPAALAQLTTVYPNPAHGSATLWLPVALRGTQATAVSVVDNLGRVVLTRTLAAGTTETLELPLATLAPGVYSVQAHTAAGLVAKRLVVQ